MYWFRHCTDASDGTKNLGDEPFPTELQQWEAKFNSQYLDMFEEFPENVSDSESDDSGHRFFDSESEDSDESDYWTRNFTLNHSFKLFFLTIFNPKHDDLSD